MPLEAEAVEQRLLHHPPLAHHRPNLLLPKEENQRQAPGSSGVFQHRVMGRELQAATIGPSLEEETVRWTILLASTSRWTRRTSAFSIARALLSMNASLRRWQTRSQTSYRRPRVVVGSCSRPGGWRRSCSTG